MRIRSVVSSVTFLVILSVSQGNAQNGVRYGLGGGLGKPMGDGSEYWNIGFSVASEAFQRVFRNGYTFYRLAYNRWGVNEGEITSQYSSEPGLDISVSGALSSVEFISGLRLMNGPKKKSGIQFFSQMGLGYYILKAVANASASYQGYSAAGSAEETEKALGINIGAGLMTIGGDKYKVCVYPMYNIVFTEGETTKYFVLDALILFGG